MRWFWTVLAMLVAVGLWFVFAAPQAGNTVAPRFEPDEPAKASAGDARPATAPPIQPLGQTTGAESGVGPAASTTSRAGATAPTGTLASSAPSSTSGAAPANPASGPTSQSATEPAAASTRQGASTNAPANAPSSPASTSTTVPSPTAAPGASTPAPTAPAAKPAVTTDRRNPNDIVRRIDDRTIELDGRYRISGNGREDDPYRISWEILTSASGYIDPAQYAILPPPWLRLLDGTHVEISGYYSTPVRVQQTQQLLLTLNRWDGCCIGLPPTPFDAIDASLLAPFDMKGLHLIRFGTFRGRLRVEVLEAAGYLLGLYRLEDATFEAK